MWFKIPATAAVFHAVIRVRSWSGAMQSSFFTLVCNRDIVIQKNLKIITLDQSDMGRVSNELNPEISTWPSISELKSFSYGVMEIWSLSQEQSLELLFTPSGNLELPFTYQQVFGRWEETGEPHQCTWIISSRCNSTTWTEHEQHMTDGACKIRYVGTCVPVSLPLFGPPLSLLRRLHLPSFSVPQVRQTLDFCCTLDMEMRSSSWARCLPHSSRRTVQHVKLNVCGRICLLCSSKPLESDGLRCGPSPG